MEEWVDGCTVGWRDGWRNDRGMGKGFDGQVKGGMDRGMGGWLDGRRDGWSDGVMGADG